MSAVFRSLFMDSSSAGHTGGVGDLLSSLPDVQDWRDAAAVGWFDGDAGLAEGFAEAAEGIFDLWQSGSHPNDRLLLPLIYNYRHAWELALKQAIREAAARIRFDGNAEFELYPENLEAHLKCKQSHRLGPLAQQLSGLLERLSLGGLPAGTMKVLAQMQQLDPRGEAFRYAHHLNTTATHVDVPALVKLFREVFGLIHGGVLTELYVHEEFQRELREAFAE